MAEDWRDDRVGAAERGENPTVLARLRTGWAVIGDFQHLPGYSLLLYHDASVDQLTELPRAERAAFLSDLALLGEAVQAACRELDSAFRRINYEVLGNMLRHLHGHVHARYDWEPEPYRSGPVWRYHDRSDLAHLLDSRHARLRGRIAHHLTRITADAYR